MGSKLCANASRHYMTLFTHSLLSIIKAILLIQMNGLYLVSTQSHYIEVAQGAIFMEQNMRFGLILGRLVILKENGGRL
jgi:hypothetical protein